MARVLKTFMANNPLATNVVIFGSLYGAGELSAQTFQGVEKYDLGAAGRMAIVGGTFFGPTYRFWYPALEKLLPGNTKKIVITKVLTDYGLMGAYGTAMFYGYSSALEGKGVKECLNEVKDKFAKTYATGWAFWPLAQGINFALLPPAMRGPYVASMSFLWTNVLCMSKSSNTEEATVCVEEPQKAVQEKKTPSITGIRINLPEVSYSFNMQQFRDLARSGILMLADNIV